MALLKRLVLPKSYLRGSNVESQLEDELEMDTNLIIEKVLDENTPLIKPSQKTSKASREDTKHEQQETSTQKKKRPPSKYNIFMKETLATLQVSHPHLLGKERFSLAVEMWNTSKK